MSAAEQTTLAASSAEAIRAEEVVRAENLRKTFGSAAAELTVFSALNFRVQPGEMVALVGPSGAGKSTLLHLLAALDTPTSGTVYFRGIALHSYSSIELAEFRNRHVGFVWQRHHLMPDFTAAENVAMPLLLAGAPAAKAAPEARRWLGEVGLGERAGHRAGELSGGEQQRVAIARALVNQPALLLADEPTGDLDAANADAVFALIERLHRQHRLTSIVATHNPALAGRANRILRLDRGQLVPQADSNPAGLRPEQAN